MTADRPAHGTSPYVDAAREHNTAAAERARLAQALSGYRCARCGARAPRVTHTVGHLRYVRCAVCRKSGKISLS